MKRMIAALVWMLASSSVHADTAQWTSAKANA